MTLADKRTFSQTMVESANTFMRLMRFTKGNRPLYFTGMLLAAGEGLIQTVAFGMGIYWILSVAETGNVSATLQVGLLVLLLCVGLVALYTLGSWMLDYGVVKVSAGARYTLIEHMARLPAGWYDKHHTGDILTRIFMDYEAGMENCLNIPIQFTLNLLMSGIASMIAIFALDWRIALVLLGVSLLSLVLTSRFVVPSRNAAIDVRSGNSFVSERLSDIVAAAPILRVHSLYSFALDLLRGEVVKNEGHVVKQGKINALQDGLGQFITLLVYVGVLSFGLFGMQEGTMNPAKLIAVLQLSSGPIGFFNGIGGMLVSLQNALAGADRVFQIFDIPEEPRGELVSPITGAPAVALSNVSFSYREDTPILCGVTLEAQDGTKTALMGESGGGKSTILKLLSGLYPAYEGSVQVFGHEVRDLPVNALRKMVHYVPQDPHLFIGTIQENIAFAKEGATLAEVITAAKLADAHEFIESLPEGYRYKISERGGNLSGGQKQRIALSRAFLKEVPLFLLDEPTSALDMASEAKVTASLGNKEQDTMLVATHRPSLLQVMEEIIKI